MDILFLLNLNEKPRHFFVAGLENIFVGSIL